MHYPKALISRLNIMIINAFLSLYSELQVINQRKISKNTWEVVIKKQAEVSSFIMQPVPYIYEHSSSYLRTSAFVYAGITSLSTRAPGSRATSHLTDFNGTLTV